MISCFLTSSPPATLSATPAGDSGRPGDASRSLPIHGRGEICPGRRSTSNIAGDDLEVGQVDGFAAAAGAHLRQDVVELITDKADRPVAEQPIAPARMPAPKMHLVTVVMNRAGLKADLGGGALAVKTPGHAVGEIGGIINLPRAPRD